MRRRAFPFLCLCMVILSGCATIMSREEYPVYIHSEPKGAMVVITDRKEKVVYRGSTPASVNLASGGGYFVKAEYKVQFTLPGYQEQTVPVKFGLNGWYFGNIILGGFLGFLIIDPLTGAMWRIKDPVVDATLIRATATSGTGPQLQVMDIRNVPPHLLPRLEKLP